MSVTFDQFIQELWEITSQIGILAETDNRYLKVYQYLNIALDKAEESGLVGSEHEEYFND